ncbi:MAG: tannase [Lachnospiraceae bacterium]|nr:tannase [Lachnospiraceae bacterium]
MREMKRRLLALTLSAGLAVSLAACGSQNADTGSQTSDGTEEAISDEADGTDAEPVTGLDKIDMAKWQYNADDDVYYQLGISYCESPADTTYETLAVFVPGGFLSAEENGDGTYTCEVDSSAKVGDYTADTAPVVMPINTPGYSAQAALTEYASYTDYTSQGLVYAHAGCRGRDAGAPAGVTDLKAAVRYIRYTDDVLPGDAERIFTFGMSGGGAQSSLMGITGDSALYDPYLSAIGAVEGVSDAVLGSMCWCPITNLDSADEAYEWMMGSTRSGLSDEEQQISDRLAEAFAAYINSAGIKDPDGNTLSLEESTDGIYQAGSYYDYMKSEVERSLNNFLSDTEFPYDASASSGGGMGGPGGGMGGPRGEGGPSFDGGEMPGADGDMGQMPDKNADAGEAAGDGKEEVSFEDIDDITRNDTTSGLDLSGTYETAQDYVDAMNANGAWVSYDEATNTATVTSIGDFVAAFKNASKNLGAFDQLDGGQGENTLFGYGDGNGAHFDSVLAGILDDLGNSYAEDYATDLAKTDALGNTVDARLDMYSPMYYLLEGSDGYQSSNVAKYWRIRTGIAQSDCALSTELNLALALENYENVSSVDFETIWGAGHTEAERTGTSTENFIAWVNACVK